MNKKLNTVITRFFVMTMLVFTLLSCSKDSDYDLSNIKTDARFEMNDLIVPINIDKVKLETVLDIKDGDDIKKGPDGYYVEKTGNFHADGISVNKIYLDSRAMQYDTQSVLVGAPSAGTYQISIPTTMSTKVSFTAQGIDSAVKSINKIGGQSQITLSIDLSGLFWLFNTVKFKTLNFNFFKGLALTLNQPGTYNPETGIIHLEDITAGTNFNLTANITEFDCDKAGAVFDTSSHSLTIDHDVTISGEMLVTASHAIQSQYAALKYGHSISRSEINKFTGKVEKAFNVNQPDPIDLSNLPEVLTQTGTSIELDNPKITIQVNNPLVEAGHTGIYAQAGLGYYSSNGISGSTANDAIKLEQAQNTKVLSAKADKAGEIKFAALSQLLVGDKKTQSIPKKINIFVNDAMVKEQLVKDFKLGEKLNAINGTWKFYTDVNITGNSQIVYKKEWTDWRKKDLDYLTVEKATVTFDVTNEVPLNIETLTFTLNGADGKMTGTLNTNIPYGETKTVVIELTGDAISKISGATIDAKVTGGNATLKPEQTITVANVRAQVSGYYEKEL